MPREPKRHRELELAIDAVAASYVGDAAINHLEGRALPNRRHVVEAFEQLRAAIFLGYHGVRTLNRDNLRHGVGEHLYRAYELLLEPIERAFAYDRSQRGEHLLEDDATEAVVLALFGRIPDLRRLLNADVVAAYRGDPAARSIEEVVFSYPSITAITAYRLAHELHVRGVPLVPRILAEHAHALTGIDIHPGASIGESFFIDHGTGVVVGETTVIGDRVKLYQNVTLGALSTARAEPGHEGKRHPTLEDDVTIYSGATILGGDTVIGRGSVVGGNVWLVKSLPPYSKIFGRAKE